jgi:hypothetical protein
MGIDDVPARWSKRRCTSGSAGATRSDIGAIREGLNTYQRTAVALPEICAAPCGSAFPFASRVDTTSAAGCASMVRFHSRPMRSALNFILYLLAFTCGGLAWAAYLEPGFALVLSDYLATANGQVVGLSVAGLFVVGPFAAVARWYQVWRRSREISYTTETGKISVNLIAVEEALTRAIEGEPDVKKATVRVFEDRAKRSIVIEAVVTLWEVANVTERNRFCQRLLRRRFAELMPEQTVVQVNLNVHRLNQRRQDERVTRPAAVPVAEPTPAAPANLNLAYETTKDSYHPAPPLGVELATTEDDLYVGPTYPVVRDEDEEGGGTQAWTRPAPGKRKHTT